MAEIPQGYTRKGMLWANAAILNGGKDSANLVLTRNGLHDWSLNRVAAGAETYRCVVSISEMRRVDFEFGEASKFGISQSNYPYGGKPPKGIIVDDIVVVYQVGVVPLTTTTLVHGKVVYVNNAVPAVTAIPIDNTALAVAVQANPYLLTRVVTAPAYVIDDNSDLQIEWLVTLAITGTIRLYGLGVHCRFDYR